MQTQRGGRGLPPIHSQPRRWKGFGGQHCVLAASPSGKTRYPLCGRLGEPQSRSGTESLVPLPTGIRSPDYAACSKLLYRVSHLAVELYEKLLD